MPYISLGKDKDKDKDKDKLIEFELIPKGAWYVNVRSRFSPEAWDKIRKWVYAQADYVCEICGGEGDKWPVECHERWEWDDERREQRLVGFMALCPKCHGVKHLGYSKRALSHTKFQKLLSHQRRVNGWSWARQQQEWKKALDKYTAREGEWKVDTSYAERLLLKLMREERG